MLQTLGLLLGCQLAGEFIARGLGLPIPGPVLSDKATPISKCHDHINL